MLGDNNARSQPSQMEDLIRIREPLRHDLEQHWKAFGRFNCCLNANRIVLEEKDGLAHNLSPPDLKP
uniref:Uncharacterized protein n=1 Tax=Physcomitrium patens TaxID=3218 RepID=A0A2K1JTJ6_PHYPA|nr:hypothetical protein PHYPA_014615 [Physcomitrium patens]